VFRDSKPFFFENSQIPIFLSKFAPIEIGAITIGPFVFSKGEMSKETKNHETIHWQQYIETGILGFVCLYYFFYLINWLMYREKSVAYYMIPFEREAHDNDSNLNYLQERKRYAWLKRGGKMGAGIMIMSFDGDEPKLLGLIGDKKHRQKHNATYDFPKGTLDMGESAWHGASRETFEETGIVINRSEVIAGPINDSWLTMWLATVPWGTTVQIGKNPATGKLEHHGYEWLTREEALKECYPYLRSFVVWAFNSL
jgi:8-oxo-dGTP pyrophosphatase MutT (NUDIX family)